MEYGKDVVVESCVASVEYGRLYPTVLGIGVELSVLTPAAIGLGISVERGNGGLDSVVKLWEIISVFMSVFPWEFPLHGVWGNLAELWWEGLVWTPRRAFPQIPSPGSGRATRSRSEVIPRPRGTGGDFRGRGRSQALRVVHG